MINGVLRLGFLYSAKNPALKTAINHALRFALMMIMISLVVVNDMEVETEVLYL